MLCYTSGTTSDPKGVLYEHRSTVLHALVEVSPDIFDLSARSVALPIVPIFHAAAWGLPFAAPIAGVKLVFSADYSPRVLCDMMREEGVTHTAGVPPVWLAMLTHVEAPGADLGRLSVVTIVASSAPRSITKFFVQPRLRVGHAYGPTNIAPYSPPPSPPPA